MSKNQIILSEIPALPGYDQYWFKIQMLGDDSKEVLLKISGSAYSTITAYYKNDSDKVLALISHNTLVHEPTKNEILISTETTNHIDENTYRNDIAGITRVSSNTFEFS
jgi:hypothetical protein